MLNFSFCTSILTHICLFLKKKISKKVLMNRTFFEILDFYRLLEFNLGSNPFFFLILMHFLMQFIKINAIFYTPDTKHRIPNYREIS